MRLLAKRKMNQLVGSAKRILSHSGQIGFRLPYSVGYAIGISFDLVVDITGKQLAIISIRVKKFCANFVYNNVIDKTGFVLPIPLAQPIEQTIRHEFIEMHDYEPFYFSE